MRKNVAEKYLHIGSIAGSMKNKADISECLDQISGELISGGIVLDNLIYEYLGMSGDDMIESLYK